jgi:hypothetical protein
MKKVGLNPSEWLQIQVAVANNATAVPSVTHDLGCYGARSTPLKASSFSTRLLGDRFALAFEFFINVGHAFVDVAGLRETFDQLVWSQALADVRGETSPDTWGIGTHRIRMR